MERVESHACFGGRQEVWSHVSEALGCTMRFGVFLPDDPPEEGFPVVYFLSGLTCTEQNFITKAGAQRYAAEHRVVVVAPDTSPRGEDVPDADGWDLGKGAGFYVDATESPWAEHYRMDTYVTRELPALIEAEFPVSDRRSLCGHSMGGHGALVLAFRNPGRYRSVSAFSPIVAPTEVPWGHKAFSAYLGEDRSTWEAYDATRLIADADALPVLVDQGDADGFLEEQLQTHRFVEAAAAAGFPVTVRMQPGYDHSYFFISTFIGEHLAFHARALAR